MSFCSKLSKNKAGSHSDAVEGPFYTLIALVHDDLKVADITTLSHYVTKLEMLWHLQSFGFELIGGIDLPHDRADI